MRVLHVASEVAPFAQTGGLADVLGGLPPALASHGITVGVLSPLYRGVEEKIKKLGLKLDRGLPIIILVGPHSFQASLRTLKHGGVTYGFVDCAPLYDRAGGLYGPNGSTDFGDNHLRFAALGKVAVEQAPLLLGDTPDVLHVHDWQGGPAAIYARLAGVPYAVISTIHNLAYRGIFDKHAMDELGWPWSLFDLSHLEFFDSLSFLKGGMSLADVVTTVSPSYAQEIVTPTFGEGLDSFLKSNVRRLVGIVNGIDVSAWDPANDPAIAAKYSATSLAGKAQCRAAIAKELGLVLGPDQPLLAVIARMTGQKGLDLVADMVSELYALDAKLVVLGSGETELESRFAYLGGTFREHVAVKIGFDINLSRRIYAGSDFFLMPSRFEPCGLGQLYAMRYGAIPIVHAVGGLRDTVADPGQLRLAYGHGTGIKFEPATTWALRGGIERAVELFRIPPAFTEARKAAMTRDSSWAASARQYVDLYKSVVRR
jgi:starch synthase